MSFFCSQIIISHIPKGEPSSHLSKPQAQLPPEKALIKQCLINGN